MSTSITLRVSMASLRMSSTTGAPFLVSVCRHASQTASLTTWQPPAAESLDTNGGEEDDAGFCASSSPHHARIALLDLASLLSDEARHTAHRRDKLIDMWKHCHELARARKRHALQNRDPRAHLLLSSTAPTASLSLLTDICSSCLFGVRYYSMIWIAKMFALSHV